MGRRGPLRTGLRDRLQRVKSSAAKPTKETPSKRQKTAASTTNGRPTPFVSTTTGQLNSYSYGNEEANTFLKCSPVNNHIEVPASASAFLMNAASHFASAVNDVLVSPEFLVVNITMNPERLQDYYKFCKPRKHRIPNSDCFLQVEVSHMEDILSEHYGFNFDTIGEEESAFMETSSSASDYSDLEIEPIPSKPSSPATIIELPSKCSAAEEELSHMFTPLPRLQPLGLLQHTDPPQPTNQMWPTLGPNQLQPTPQASPTCSKASSPS